MPLSLWIIIIVLNIFENVNIFINYCKLNFLNYNLIKGLMDFIKYSKLNDVINVLS